MSSEVIYSSEKTNLDPQLEALCKQADEARNWTQKIVKDTESVLTPNPGKQYDVHKTMVFTELSINAYI